MKKLVFVMLLVFLAMQTASFAAMENKKVAIGLFELPALSIVHNDENKQVTSYTGVNWAMGFTHRMFFEPLKVNEVNTNWEFGTIFLLLPYAGIGADYVWENGWYVGIGTLYIFPYPRLGVFL